MSRILSDLLSPERITEVVDVGANPIDGDPPYKPMLAAGLCRVTGFEPQQAALRELERKKGPNERYLPYAVGDGAAHTLNMCRAPGMTSLLQPDPKTLDLFGALKPLAEVIERIPVQTRTLDEIAEVERLDFLKIDVQGGELAVFQGGTARLSQAVAIQTEVSFVTLYRDQPVFGEVDLELRGQGFLPHCFAEVTRWPIAPFAVKDDPRQPLKQLLEADIVYVRDISRPGLMRDEQLKHLALIAHHCYRSFDLALRCVMLLEQRQALKPGAQQAYVRLLAGSPLA
jgi:FkbM family methyltransferase